MSTTTFRYSVVVPVYNEGANIAQFCAEALTLPRGGEFLFVYDFEEDDTLPALAALDQERKPEGIRTVRTQGRGVRDAIVTGLHTASAPVILVMMADLSDDTMRVAEMIERVEGGADVVCASRYMKGGKQIGGPPVKKLMSRLAGVSLHWLGGLPVHDATNSFKAYSRELIQSVTIESTAGFALGIELTVKAHFSGRRVEEVPSIWRDRQAGASRFRVFAWLPHYLHWYFWALRRRWFRG